MRALVCKKLQKRFKRIRKRSKKQKQETRRNKKEQRLKIFHLGRILVSYRVIGDTMVQINEILHMFLRVLSFIDPCGHAQASAHRNAHFAGALEDAHGFGSLSSTGLL
jgi:hypothetical protein